MTRRYREIFFGALVALGSLHCGGNDATQTPAPNPEIWVAGCKEFRQQTCIQHPDVTEVVVWINADPTSPIELWVDGVARPTEPRAVEGGTQLRLNVAVESATVSLNGRDQPWEKPWTISVERLSQRSWLRVLSVLVEEKKLEEATEHLRTELTAMDGFLRLRALDKLRRVLSGRGRARESWEVGVEQIALARKLDAPRMETYALITEAVGRLVKANDPAGARKRLARLRELAVGDPVAGMRADYLGGLLARRAGDVDGAIRMLRASRVAGNRLGDDLALLDVVEMESIGLGELGRGDEALELSRRALELVRGTKLDCNRAQSTASNIGWGMLVLAAADLPHDDPHPYLLEASRKLEQCPNAWSQANVFISLALAELQERNPADALGWLARIETLPTSLGPWADEARARAGAQLSDPEVEPSLLAIPRSGTDGQLRWNALVRRADSARRWGFLEAAVATYREAEALLDERLDAVGIDAGTELFLAGRTASVEGLVRTLYDLGRFDEALCAARVARARGLARLDRVAHLAGASEEELDRWNDVVFDVAATRRKIAKREADFWSLSLAERPGARTQIETDTRAANARLDQAMRALGLQDVARSCEDLRAPTKGEVLIVLIESQGDWIAFAARDGVVDAALVGTATLWADGDWLSGFGAVKDASEITLVPAGASWGLPLQAAKWRGRPLIELAPVRYSLDLPARPSEEEERERTALVVADPGENLTQARTEATAVADALRSAEWAVDARVGEAASAKDVGAALSEAKLFHYAGHGDWRGVSGWDSALVLADGERFGVHDVLALPQVPEGVVLTGCLTGAVSPDTLGGGMNLSRAFVLAGSSWVVASDAKVSDELARDLGISLYGTGAPPDSGPAALRQALLKLREKDPSSPWTSFRVVTPIGGAAARAEPQGTTRSG